MTKRADQSITPLSQMETRWPEAGRIRLGKQFTTRNGKKAPGKLATLRFTSQWKDVLDELQPHVGGEVQPWNEPKASPANQFELISSVAEIPIYILPGGLSCWYEMWSGGGCERRCDGVQCTTPVEVGNDCELTQVQCQCIAQGVRLCEPYTRLSVVIPQIRFRGVWRLDTKGWNAQAELPGMFDAIEALNTEGGMVQAMLGMVQVEKATKKGKNNYVKPVLSLHQSVMALQSGLANAQLMAGSGVGTAQLALPTAAAPLASPPTSADADDEIVEAEIIDEEYDIIVGQLRSDARQFDVDVDRFERALCKQVQAEKDGTPCDIERQKTRLRLARQQMASGKLIPRGFKRDGGVQWEVVK